MSHLILVRHGQSEWNLENRFTGWVDVDLAPKGKLEACKSGEFIKEQKIKIDYFFTSYQKRAINTLKLILDTLRINIPAQQFHVKKISSASPDVKAHLTQVVIVMQQLLLLHHRAEVLEQAAQRLKDLPEVHYKKARSHD